MDLVDDLGCDLALAVLVEKKHRKKIDSSDVLPLITKIKEALRSISAIEDFKAQSFNNERTVRAASH